MQLTTQKASEASQALDNGLGWCVRTSGHWRPNASSRGLAQTDHISFFKVIFWTPSVNKGVLGQHRALSDFWNWSSSDSLGLRFLLERWAASEEANGRKNRRYREIQRKMLLKELWVIQGAGLFSWKDFFIKGSRMRLNTAVSVNGNSLSFYSQIPVWSPVSWRSDHPMPWTLPDWLFFYTFEDKEWWGINIDALSVPTFWKNDSICGCEKRHILMQKWSGGQGVWSICKTVVLRFMREVAANRL